VIGGDELQKQSTTSTHHLLVILHYSTFTPPAHRLTESAFTMGKHSDKMYITHSEHAAGSHSAAGSGKRAETGHQEMMRLPL